MGPQNENRKVPLAKVGSSPPNSFEIKKYNAKNSRKKIHLCFKISLNTLQASREQKLPLAKMKIPPNKKNTKYGINIHTNIFCLNIS